MKHLTYEQILGELESYEKLLGEPIDTKDLDSMKQRGAELVGYLSRSAVLYAEAQKLHNEAKVQAYHRLQASSVSQEKYYSPMLAKDYVAARCSKEKYLADLADRINAAITHTLDYIRSAMSAEKTQLAYLNMQT